MKLNARALAQMTAAGQLRALLHLGGRDVAGQAEEKPPPRPRTARMQPEARAARYVRQNPARSKLTGPQVRRLAHKAMVPDDRAGYAAGERSLAVAKLPKPEPKPEPGQQAPAPGPAPVRGGHRGSRLGDPRPGHRRRRRRRAGR